MRDKSYQTCGDIGRKGKGYYIRENRDVSGNSVLLEEAERRKKNVLEEVKQRFLMINRKEDYSVRDKRLCYFERQPSSCFLRFTVMNI